MEKNNKKNGEKLEHGYFSLAELAKDFPYTQEYLSLLARQGKLKAKKFGRNWFTTKEALDEYLTKQGIKIVLPKHLFNASYKGKIKKSFNLFPSILTQFQPPEEPIRLSGVPEEEPQKIERAEKEVPEEKVKVEKEKILEPSLIRTMQKDIVTLGGKEIVEKKKIFLTMISQLRKLGKIFLKKEKIKVPEKVPEKIPEKIPIPEKVLVMEKKEEVQAPPVIEKVEKPREVPIEERVLEKLLQAIEAKIPPAGVTAGIARLNGMANQYFRSMPRAILVSIIAIIILLLLVGGVTFGNLDKVMLAVNNFFKDAVTLQGKIPGTHANEVLLLDKNGNISIYGHIETKGQLRSWVEQGVAPIVVISTTTVENLSADYLDNLSSEQFTLAFVTKNGNITYEDVYLEGNVEVGKTLLVKGAAKLLDSLFVYGNLGVFGDAEIRGLTRALGGIETRGANLNLGSGTIITTNRNLIANLNADMVDSMHATDFTLDFVTSQGNNTFNTISVGGLNVNGFLGAYDSFRLGDEREVGLIDTRYWDITALGHINTLGNINAKGSLTIGDNAVFKKNVNVNGNVVVDGILTAASLVSAAGDSTVRKSGEEVFREIVPISRYDIPAQTSTTTYFRISKYFDQNPLASVPEPLPGATRVYKLIIKYNDDIPTNSSSSWRIYRSTAATTSDSFLLLGRNSSSLSEGIATTTANLTIPSSDWQVELKLSTADSDKTIRIFQIFLAAFDKIN